MWLDNKGFDMTTKIEKLVNDILRLIDMSFNDEISYYDKVIYSPNVKKDLEDLRNELKASINKLVEELR